MTPQDNPYNSLPEYVTPEIPLHTKVVAVLVGLIVFAGTGITLGIFLFAALVLSAGKQQPLPIARKELLESSSQKLILGIGSSFVILFAGALAGWVFFRILKSQRMKVEVLFRRRELQTTVSKLHASLIKKT